MSEEEVLETAKATMRILGVRRLNRRTIKEGQAEYTPTQSVVITFTGKKSPKVDIEYYKIKNSCRTLGLTKSTPIKTVLPEAGEMPLELRRRWISTKFISKHINIIDDIIYNNMISIYTNINNGSNYWKNVPPPALIEGLDRMLQHIQRIHKSHLLPCYEFSRNEQIETNLRKEENNKRKFLQIIESYTDYTICYTDASVDPETKTCGIGIVCEDPPLKIHRRLSDNTPICTAETIAIREAVRSLAHQSRKLIIVTDSLSGIQAITRTGINKDTDYITLSTRQEILKSKDTDIKLLWVPSHTEIRGNEKADETSPIRKKSGTSKPTKPDRLKKIYPRWKSSNMVYVGRGIQDVETRKS
ncbi:uncharacterized protein LOC126747075 [Anthonomus grandis grandis]|uniref:uncharacterized protein LOC126747075 n=1 Tax=Anthonomus grandis grandis TaxID=2921223 RepID=UPI002165E964|nr:uncharacterized protein LOC126747075 [Anthonomus grandis grandis]